MFYSAPARFGGGRGGNVVGHEHVESHVQATLDRHERLGGLIAGKIFTEIWQRVNPEDEEPDPKDLSRSAREVFIAAAVQGVMVGLVRAVLARGQAKGFAALTDEDLR